MTLALLITAVTGAWAAETLVTIDAADYDMISTATSFSKEKDGITIAFSSAKKLASYFELQSSTTVTITSTVGKIKSVVFSCPAMGTAKYGPGCLGSPTAGQYSYIDMTGTWTGEAESFTLTSSDKVRFDLIYVTVGEPDATEPTIDVTTNAASKQDLFTTASFTMPAFDATVNYELVRDMQDKANPVAFSGLPSSGNIVVKKGSDGKYQPAEALTIQLIDPLAAADAQNIIRADGITVKVLVGDDSSLPIEYDHISPITLDDFLADMKPGYYWIKAEPTDENSPYDGTVYSQEFLLLNGYELTIPAGEYATFYKDENLYTEDENAELYTISEVNATQAVLSDAVQIMPKNTPMLVYNKGTEEKTFLLIPTEDEANQVTAANEFKGTLSTMGMPGSTSITDYYVCTGKAFRWVKNAGTIAANKCWLQIGEQPATTRANTRSIVGGGNTTGIDGIENDESAVEGYYDLNGRKLQGKPTRGGIYIQNGRKVIVR